MNLVFDKWDENGNPIPNLNYLNDEIKIKIVTYPRFINELDIEKSKIKQCKLDDINDTENFYYVISYLDECLFFLKNNKILLSDEVKYHITNNNLKVIFISTHETPQNLIPFIVVLRDNIKKNKWKEENFYIINNNSMLYKIKEELNTNINFYKSNALLKMVSADIKVQPNENNIVYNKKFIFLNQNRLPHEHRIILLTYLKSLKLLENDITNWSLVVNYMEHQKNNKIYSTINSLEKIDKKYIDVTNNGLVKSYKEMINTKKLDYYEQNVTWADSKKIDYFEQDINWFDNIDNYVQLDHLTLETYENSYINIITETHFESTKNSIHITEKSFKPFYYFQIPIFVAPYNHVKMIKKEYDFDLFDDLINHSYDDEPDNVKRFNMIVDEIKRLSTMRDEIKLYYKNNINRILHNHRFVKEYSNKKIDENYFLKL